MKDLRQQLVDAHGEDIVSAYESYFPDELEMFDDRYCGYIGDVREWAQECLESAYEGFDDEVIPCLESYMEMEFPDYYIYDEDLEIGFVIR